MFAPKFNQFGIDLARRLVSEGAVSRVDGFCTGGSTITKSVQTGLGNAGGDILNMELIERRLLNEYVSHDKLIDVERLLPQGAFGRIITADRRVGSGFVSGGIVQPSYAKSKASSFPQAVPDSYCANLVVFIHDYFIRTRPKFVFLYANAGAVTVTICELAGKMGIPVFGLVPTRVENYFTVDRLPLGLLEPVHEYKKCDLNKEDWEFAEQSLTSFRDTPAAPEYMALAQRRSNLRDLARMSVLALRDTVKAYLLCRSEHRLFMQFRAQDRWFQLATYVRTKIAWRRRFSKKIPPDRTIIYYPLHVDPESSTMVMSPYHTNQISIIEGIAKSIPSGALLVVKEHAPMVGKRPGGFYKMIEAMPRVLLLSPSLSGLDCVRRADLTVVITGTAAWEALRLKKRALVLGASPFLKLGASIMHEPSIASLPQAIETALLQPIIDDDALKEFLAKIHAVSFQMHASLLWGNYQDHSSEERMQAVRHIASRLLKMLA